MVALLLRKENQISHAVPFIEFNLVNGGKPYEFVLKLLNFVDDVSKVVIVESEPYSKMAGTHCSGFGLWSRSPFSID